MVLENGFVPAVKAFMVLKATKFHLALFSLLVFSTALPIQASAEEFEKQCLSFPGGIVSFNFKEAPKAPPRCEELEYLSDAVVDIKKMWPDQKIPIFIISTDESPLVAAYDLRYSNVLVGTSDGSPASTAANVAIFVHEYGHNVFQSLIAEALPLVREIEARKYANFLKLQRLMPYIQLLQESKCEPGSDCFKKAERAFADNPTTDDDERSFFESHRAEIEKIMAIAGPYHELFADLFAAAFANNPDVVKSALEYYHHADESHRGFTNVGAPGNQIDPHRTLSGAREKVWLRYIKHLQEGSRESALRIIGRIFVNEIQSDLAAGTSANTQNLLRALESDHY